jgi:regulator of nucleoside diphosphate kinase
MVTEPRFHLTTRDHAVLRALLDDDDGPHGPYRLLLQRKLTASAVALRDDVGPGVATLGARVSYTVNGVPAGPHLLVQENAPDLPRDPDLPHDKLSIRTMRGLALIGLGEGGAIRLDLGNGAVEELAIVRVLPETAERVEAPAADQAAARLSSASHRAERAHRLPFPARRMTTPARARRKAGGPAGMKFRLRRQSWNGIALPRRAKPALSRHYPAREGRISFFHPVAGALRHASPSIDGGGGARGPASENPRGSMRR